MGKKIVNGSKRRVVLKLTLVKKTAGKLGL